MADDRTIRVRLQAEIQSYVANMRTAAAATTDFGRQVSGMGKASSADIEKVGRAALVMSAGIGIALGLSAKAAMDWESAWAGVTKTVEGTDAQMSQLEEGLREMATTLPATHQEIAAVAEAAGALGIATPAVEGFTRTMIDLGETTDLTADQAAEAFARIANIMQIPQDQFDEMGSTVVDLGNNLAATESEITEMALRIAGAGNQIGLSADQVLGFAGALSSVGIEAEAGGTAISRVFIELDTAVRTGGESLASFAQVAGMTADEFASAYQQDAAGAIASFIEGLNGISESGGNVFGVLEQLGLSDIRVRDALLRMAGAGDLVRESLDLGAEAWETNTALADEAALRYETTAAQMEILRNQVVDLGIDIGGELLPALRGAVDAISTLVTGFSSMPGPMQNVLVLTAALATGVLGVVGLLGTLVPKIIAARNALMSMGVAGQFLARNMTMALGVLGLFLVAGTAVAFVMGKNAEKAQAVEANMRSLAEAMRAAGSEAEGLVDHLTGLLVDSPMMASVLADAGVSVSELGAAMQGTDAEWLTMVDHLHRVAEESGMSGLALDALVAGLEGQRTAARDAAAQNENLAEVNADVGTSAADAAPGIDDLTSSTDDLEQAAKDAQEAVDDLLGSLSAAVDPVFGLIDAQDGLQDAYAELDRVMRDSESTAEDVEDAQRGVRDSAAEMDRAIYELAAGLADGTVSAEAFDETLQRWVEQGSITEAQAAALRDRMREVSGEADVLAAKDQIDFVVTWSGEAAQEALSNAIRDAAILDAILRNLSRNGARQSTGVGGGNTYLAAGGPVYAASGFFTPRGTDTVPAMLTPGEFVMRKGAVDRFGADFMSALNAGQMRSVPFSPGGGVGGGGAVDRSLHVTVQGGATVTNRTVGDIVWSARKVEMEVAGG